MNADSIRERYDTVPYRHGAISDSHPARIGFIARLFGIQAAPPDRCRVLELGCGEGMNLLPLAERFPDSEFVGVDFSGQQIAVAEAARVTCGIKNASYVCADLRDWECKVGAFDYVIAHGVYSWVPPDVRDRLLTICAKAASSNGVVYVSYNTLPGWGLPGGVRRFLLSELATHSTHDAQIAHACRLLDAAAVALKNQPGTYAANLRETIADMRRKPPELLFHDELATVNQPFTFVEFMEHASRHGLHYLAEAHYATMQFEHVPAEMRAALAPLQLDFMRTQQFMDVLFQRWLRNSLLGLAHVAAERTIRTEVFAECAMGLRMVADSARSNLAPGVPMRLTSFQGLAMESSDPVEKAVLSVLASSFPQRLPFPAVCAMANQALTDEGFGGIANFPALHGFLHRLFALDVLDVMLCGGGEWLKSSATLSPSALMHYQALHDLPLTNRWHEPISLTPEGRHALADPAVRLDATALAKAGLLA